MYTIKTEKIKGLYYSFEVLKNGKQVYEASYGAEYRMLEDIERIKTDLIKRGEL